MLVNLLDVISTKPMTDTSRCGGACKLCNNCTAPLQPKIGTNGIMLVLESPTEQEDTFKEPLLGVPGKRLRFLLDDVGINIDECTITYAIKCHTGEIPTKMYETAIESCRIDLLKLIDETKPTNILLFGHAAISSVISYDYQKAAGGTDAWVGFRIPSRKFNAWLHPIYNITMPYQFNDPALDLLFDGYVKEVAKYTKRPWETIPDEAKEVSVLYDTDEINEKIRAFRKESATVAFDFETTSLKPDAAEQDIYSCSLCYMGRETISFLWSDAVKEEMRRLLHSARTRLLGANYKFDWRFAKAKMGIEIKGLFWDCVLAAHLLDSRPNITSLKTQSYLRYGLPDYSSQIKKYFEAPGSNESNNIRNCPVEPLLTYGAIDALMTYRVSCDQMREMKYPFGE